MERFKLVKPSKEYEQEELECIKNWINEADESKYKKWVIELKKDNTPIRNISVNGIIKKIITVMLGT